MALVARAAGVLPLLGAMAVAVALTGVAVFTVSQSSCATPGHYVLDNGQLRLIGGCVDTDELPSPPPRSADTAHNGGSRQSRP